MTLIQKKFGLRVRELRKNSRQTQESLAEKLDIDVRSLRKIEAGESFPSVRTLEALVENLDTDLRELFDFEHLQPVSDLRESIINMLDDNPDKLQDIYKIVKALVS